MKKLVLAVSCLAFLSWLPAMIEVEAQPAKDVKKLRGLKPAKRNVLASAPRYHSKLTAVPSYYFRLPKKLSTWGNNQYGDCVTAESAFNRACAGVFITEAEVIRWARANGVLNGADLNQVIELQRSKGFSQDGNIYGNGPGKLVNYADAPTMKAALYEAGLDKGCISIGISADMLPSGAGQDNGWFKNGATNDESEDHCVSLCGFGTAQQFVTAINAAYSANVSVPSGFGLETQGYALYTWNTVGFVETSSCVGMMGEAWIRHPSTIIAGTGAPTPDEVYVTGDTPIPIPPPGPGPTPPPPIPGTWPKITLSQAMPAGTFVGMPEGTPEAILEADTAFQKLKATVSPVQPTPAPGGLEKRVDGIETDLRSLKVSIDALSKAILGNK